MVSRVVLTGLLLIGTAMAHAGPGDFEITPMLGFSTGGTFEDQDLDASAKLKDAPAFSMLVNVRETANTQWEILYTYQSNEAEFRGVDAPEGTLDMDFHYLQGGGTYQGDGELIRPYLAATIGATFVDVKTEGFDSDTFFSFSIGPGIQYRPTANLGLRLEARAYGTLLRSNTSIFCISDPGNIGAGCAINSTGKVLWRVHAQAGVVFRF